MSATDKLCRMLAKMGVEYVLDEEYGKKYPPEQRVTWSCDIAGDDMTVTARDYCIGRDESGEWEYCLDLEFHEVFTPEQAIAATLGTGTLTAEQVSNATYAHSIHADCVDADWQAIADELNDTLRRGTCHMVYNDLSNLSRCTACGWRMNGVPMYYCPRCGRKVVDR